MYFFFFFFFRFAHVITVNNRYDFYRLNINQYGVLTIKGALPEDAGNYTCLATNEAGTASQSVLLTFSGKSSLQSCSGSSHQKSTLFIIYEECERIS